MDFSAQQIAAFVQGEIVGDANATVNTFAKIEEGKPGSITFLANPKYAQYIYPELCNRRSKSQSACACSFLKLSRRVVDRY